MLRRRFVALLGLLCAGVVSLPAAASAADPYPGTVTTTCTVDLDASADDRRLSAAIDVLASGNAPVRGTLVAVFEGPGGVELATRSVDYSGGRIVVNGPKATDKGRYLVDVGFQPRSGSVYTSCEDQDGVDVGVGGTGDGDDDGDDDTDPPPAQGGVSGDGVLPDTGGQPMWVPLAGAAFVLLGAALMFTRRRRTA